MYSVKSFASDGKSLETIEAIQTACLKKGDEILIINLQGTSTFVNNVGNWETLIVDSVAGHKITFTTKKSKFYGAKANDDSGIGVATNTQRVMVQRVPNYDNVTINKGATLTVSAFTDRKKGGVVFFRAKGNVVVNGTISAAMSGYQGGVSDDKVHTPVPSGDSLFVDLEVKGGFGAGSAGQYATEEFGKSVINGYAGTCSGGGGAGVWGKRSNEKFVGTAGVGRKAKFAAGGGGGGSATGCRFMAYGWWRTGHGGGGGGGGHATPGTGGVVGNNDNGKYYSCNPGGNGTADGSGNGGAPKVHIIKVGSYCNEDSCGDDYSCNGYAGGGGGGAGGYVSRKLEKLLFGSGGGAGGTGTYGGAGIEQIFLMGGNGGRGGGIIFVAAKKISVTGLVSASGGAGGPGSEYTGKSGYYNTATSGGGGGGAGGSIRLESQDISIGKDKVVAVGGASGIGKGSCGGGTGGVGVVALYNKASLQGTSSPAATSISF